ncbi:MAG: response regulator [Desulfobulbaceae bacterium]|nr:response regulator [Desulfobulbaceae bacterium]HIJ77990.1 response regulator [Deltaproteobacteria bacterium]
MKLSDEKIRGKILVSTGIVFVLLLLVFLFTCYQLKERFFVREMQIRTQELQSHVDHALDRESAGLEVLLSLFQLNPQLKASLRSRDVVTLRRQVDPLFLMPQSGLALHHLCFYDHNFKSIYEQYGSANEPEVALVKSLLAESAAALKTVSAIELDSSGKVILLMAAPLVDENGLSGFALLGKEVNSLVSPGQDLAATLSAKSYVLLLNKKYLDREKWEEAVKMVGVVPQWEMLADVVVARQSLAKEIGIEAMAYLKSREAGDEAPRIKVAGRYFQVIAIPLFDGLEQEFGSFLIFVDIHDSVVRFQYAVSGVVAFCLILGAVLYLLTHVYSAKMEEKLAKFRQQLTAETRTRQEDLARFDIDTHQSREYLQNIIECIGDPIMVVDRKYQVVLANLSVRNLVRGDDPVELQMSCCSIFLPPEESDGCSALDGAAWDRICQIENCPAKQVFESKLPAEKVSVLKTRQGEMFTAEIMAWPVLDDYDEVEQVILVYHNISKQKQVEEKLRKLSRAVEQSPVSVVITDTNGMIEYVNPKFSEVTGYTFNEAVGQNPNLLKSGLQPFELYSELWKTISAGNEWRGELCNRKKDGTFYWEAVEISPIRNDRGEITHYLALKEDITKNKEREQELIKAKEEAEETSRLREQFITNMTHELRTPLNGILGMSSLLLNTELTAQQQKYLMMCQSSANALLRIINDLLDLARLKAQKLNIDELPFDLDFELDEMLAPFFLEAESKGVTLSKRMDPAVPTKLIGDPGRLRQIMVNLVNNAIKFTEQGLVEVEVRVGGDQDVALKHRLFICFIVRDTGIGIPKDKLTDIFDEFVQLDGSMTRRYGGTGIGLFFSKMLAESLGGRIWAESVENKGSIFYCSIPYGLQEAQADEEAGLIVDDGDHADVATSLPISAASVDAEAADGLLAGQGAFSAHKNILVAEDDFINRELIKELLGHAPWKITTTNDGQEAVDACRSMEFDLILLDIQMPRMDGLQATAAIRQLEQASGRHTPIIALTAHAKPGYRAECLAAGMDDYIAKPFNPEKLYAIINKYLALPLVDNHHTDDQSGQSAVVPDEVIIDSVVNLSMIKKSLHGNVEVLKRLVGHLLENYPDDMQTIAAIIESGDAAALNEKAHALKGILLNFGADNAAALAYSLEKMGTEQNLTEAKNTFKALEKEMALVQRFFNETNWF